MIKDGGLNDISWHEDALCGKPEHVKKKPYFFSKVAREKYDAKNICYSCPVRTKCLKWALENKQIHGVWGGKDEGELRRALSVSHTGQEIRRKRFPNCPHCGARPSKLHVIVADSPEGGRWTKMKLVECKECKFIWRSRTSANAVEAYNSMRTDREERAKKAKAKKSAKKKSKKKQPEGKTSSSQ